jgi:hypothetical protein
MYTPKHNLQDWALDATWRSTANSRGHFKEARITAKIDIAFVYTRQRPSLKKS